jgi:hypothetical protein
VTRTRPRKPRNAYRDAIWQSAVLRCWTRNSGQADLDGMFNSMMQEIDMGDVQIAITLKGRECRLSLPVLTPGNIEAALGRMDWWRKTAAADQKVLDADRVLDAIAKASST